MMTATSATRPVLTVVSNADEKFFPGLAVALASAVAAASGKFDYQFLILDGGLNPADMEELAGRLTAIAARRGIRATLSLLPIDSQRLAVLPERRGSRMFYAKLVLPEVLPQLDSLVYLDADVTCFAGIEAVRPPSAPEDFLLAGALDFFSTLERDCPWLDQLPANERQLPYINSGVMWMNLKGLREMNFTERAIETRASVAHARHADQAVFNFLCRGKICVLPDAINHRTAIGSSRELLQGLPRLNIHYIGSPKPWLGPPKTSNWLAHRLWHQARAEIFPETGPAPATTMPHNMREVLLKSWLYKLTNPGRAAHYRCDLQSLADPGRVLAQGQRWWSERFDT